MSGVSGEGNPAKEPLTTQQRLRLFTRVWAEAALRAARKSRDGPKVYSEGLEETHDEGSSENGAGRV